MLCSVAELKKLNSPISISLLSSLIFIHTTLIGWPSALHSKVTLFPTVALISWSPFVRYAGTRNINSKPNISYISSYITRILAQHRENARTFFYLTGNAYIFYLTGIAYIFIFAGNSRHFLIYTKIFFKSHFAWNIKAKKKVIKSHFTCTKIFFKSHFAWNIKAKKKVIKSHFACTKIFFKSHFVSSVFHIGIKAPRRTSCFHRGEHISPLTPLH